MILRLEKRWNDVKHYKFTIKAAMTTLFFMGVCVLLWRMMSADELPNKAELGIFIGAIGTGLGMAIKALFDDVDKKGDEQ